MMATWLIRTLIVDDEQPARNRVLKLLQREVGVEIIGEAASGEEALRLIRKERPDLLFLDIQMAELDGFDVLRTVPPIERPLTIFVTAYDQYALAAFEAHAIDYLLKPYSDERFEIAMARARRFLATGPEQVLERVQALLNHIEPAPSTIPVQEESKPSSFLDRIVLKKKGHLTLLSVDQIRWIEAAGVYVKMHTEREVLLHRALLGRLAEQLDPQQFVRVHRSAVVNVEFIQALIPDTHGEYAVLLKDNTRLKLTRTYRPVLEARLKQTL